MEIKVTGIQVLREGDNDKGHWKLIKITSEQGEYTTFAQAAESIVAGSLIDITDIGKDKQGRDQFKTFQLLQAVATQPAAEPAPPSSQTPVQKSDGKNRGYALAYAKDLAVSGVIDRAGILSWAEMFSRYMDGDLNVKDEAVAKLLLE